MLCPRPCGRSDRADSASRNCSGRGLRVGISQRVAERAGRAGCAARRGARVARNRDRAGIARALRPRGCRAEQARGDERREGEPSRAAVKTMMNPCRKCPAHIPKTHPTPLTANAVATPLPRCQTRWSLLSGQCTSVVPLQTQHGGCRSRRADDFPGAVFQAPQDDAKKDMELLLMSPAHHVGDIGNSQNAEGSEIANRVRRVLRYTAH